jgi:hypothetical protein
LQEDAALRVDRHLARDRVGKGQVDGAAPGEAGVELVRHLPGALLHALAARRAAVEIHVARVLLHGDPKGPLLARDGDDLGVRQELHVGVAGALDHLGRQDADGAVVGRERLVQLRHPAADRR